MLRIPTHSSWYKFETEEGSVPFRSLSETSRNLDEKNTPKNTQASKEPFIQRHLHVCTYVSCRSVKRLDGRGPYNSSRASPSQVSFCRLPISKGMGLGSKPLESRPRNSSWVILVTQEGNGPVNALSEMYKKLCKHSQELSASLHAR